MEASSSQSRWLEVQRLCAEIVGLDEERRDDRLRRIEDATLRSDVEQLLNQLARGESIDRLGVLSASKPQSDLSAAYPSTENSSANQKRHDDRKRVGRYVLREELGRGAMGVVYRAEDTRLGRAVALKFLSPELSADERARARLEREARAASALDHPNICTVYEIGEADDGRLYLALACYEGETLEERIARGPLEVEQAARIASQIARGLAAAHRQGIVHRDVKPSNVLVTDTGEVKLLDFGIARVADSELTGTGDTLGTAAYMSPEQLRGQPEPRSDVWALGVVLYEMLAGRRPFKGDYEAALLYAILHEEPPPLSDVARDVPEELERVVSRCLEKDPEARYQSADDVAADVEHWLQRSTASVTSRSAAVKDTGRRVLLLPVVLTLALVVGFLVPEVRTRFTEKPVAADALEQTRIAVLPFTVSGVDASAATFSSGLTEVLISTLAQVDEKLWVVPLSEIRGLGVASAEEARRIFGVDLVVTGSIHKDSDHIRSSLSLVDASTLRLLHSEVSNAPVDQGNTLQDEVVANLQAMLDLEPVESSSGVPNGGTVTASTASDLYRSGMRYLERDESATGLDQAAHLFEEALDKNPGYALAHAALGEVHLRQYETTMEEHWIASALRHTQRALLINRNLAPVHVTLGRIYSAMERTDTAMREFERALEIDSTSAPAYQGLAKLREARGDFTAAESAYRRAVELRPDQWAGYNDLGAFYFNRGRFDDALRPLERVVEFTDLRAPGISPISVLETPDGPGEVLPGKFEAYTRLEEVYKRQGRQSDARAMYERLVGSAPSSEAFSRLGDLYYYAGLYTDALAAYTRAVSLRGGAGAIRGPRGRSYRRDPEQYSAWGSMSIITEYLTQMPGKETPLTPLPEAPAEFDEFSSAAEFFRMLAIELGEERTEQPNADVPLVLSRLAIYYAHRGSALLDDRGLALERLEKALRLAPTNADVLFNAACAYEMLGMRDEAVEKLSAALQRGYPLAQVEHELILRDLRTDLRYQSITRPSPENEG